MARDMMVMFSLFAAGPSRGTESRVRGGVVRPGAMHGPVVQDAAGLLEVCLCLRFQPQPVTVTAETGLGSAALMVAATAPAARTAGPALAVLAGRGCGEIEGEGRGSKSCCQFPFTPVK